MNRIIVAEHEPFLARMLRLALVRSGYRVKTAKDGNAAWDMMIAEPPGALVAAADLPGVGGLELCQRMRRELPHRDMPAIITLSQANENVRNGARQFGRVVVLDKPISIRNLLSKLDGFFSGDSMVDTLVGEDRVR